MKNLKGTFILLLAAFIWGTAFVAQTSASEMCIRYRYWVEFCVEN